MALWEKGWFLRWARKVQGKIEIPCAREQEVFKEWWGHVKETQNPAWMCLRCPILEKNLSIKINNDNNELQPIEKEQENMS